MVIVSYIPPAPPPAPLIVAHRGSSAVAPENTISAFRAAQAAGADLYELDVHLTKDGKVVVLHDATLARTTNVEELYPGRKPWHVNDFTLSEIRTLDAGAWFAKQYSGEPVPTLLSVLDTMKNGPGLALEVKKQRDAPLMARRLSKLLPMTPPRTIVQSFDASFIQLLKVKTDVGVLGETPIEGLRALSKYADYASVPREMATAAYVRRAHRVGLKVLAYTVNTDKAMNRVLDAGVDGMMTNRPRVLRKYLQVRNDRLNVHVGGYPFSWLTVDVIGGKIADDRYTRKIRKFFDLLDDNGDESLSLEDFMDAATRVAQSFGFAEGTPEHQRVVAAYSTLWADVYSNMDETLSFDKMISAHETSVLMIPGGYERVRPVADTLLTLADADQDDVISKLEYVRILHDAFRVPEDEAGEAFDTLDPEGKGKLTRRQIHRAAEGFFCTANQKTYGSAMFGRF